MTRETILRMLAAVERGTNQGFNVKAVLPDLERQLAHVPDAFEERILTSLLDSDVFRPTAWDVARTGRRLLREEFARTRGRGVAS